ncbi:MAG: MFS transporter [Candidatus Dormibacteria bacterium]
MGVYRLWRDGGYAVGPLVLGAVAAGFGLPAAFWTIVVVMGLSGIVVVVFMRETEPRRRRLPPAWEQHPEWVRGGSG